MRASILYIQHLWECNVTWLNYTVFEFWNLHTWEHEVYTSRAIKMYVCVCKQMQNKTLFSNMANLQTKFHSNHVSHVWNAPEKIIVPHWSVINAPCRKNTYVKITKSERMSLFYNINLNVNRTVKGNPHMCAYSNKMKSFDVGCVLMFC